MLDRRGAFRSVALRRSEHDPSDRANTNCNDDFPSGRASNSLAPFMPLTVDNPALIMLGRSGGFTCPQPRAILSRVEHSLARAALLCGARSKSPARICGERREGVEAMRRHFGAVVGRPTYGQLRLRARVGERNQPFAGQIIRLKQG
jgi:hypothetical protein